MVIFPSAPFSSVAFDSQQLAPLSMVRLYSMKSGTAIPPTNEFYKEVLKRGIKAVIPGIHDSLIDSSPRGLNLSDLGFIASTSGSFEIGPPQATEKSVVEAKGRMGGVTLHGIVFAGTCVPKNANYTTGLETVLTYYFYNRLKNSGYGNRVVLMFGNITMIGFLHSMTWTASNTELGLISWTLNFKVEDDYKVAGVS